MQFRTFDCDGAEIRASMHPADGTTGVLIVTGGTQIRCGPNRLFANIAAALAADSIPAYRYDRRGVGDSDGDDPGYLDAEADLAAALADFREAQPQLTEIVGLGLCDGATVLMRAESEVDRAILLNPWTFEADDMPSDAAPVAAHYRRRVLQPTTWKRLLTGQIDVATALRSVLALPRSAPATGFAAQLSAATEALDGRALYILSSRDRTADAFAAGHGKGVRPIKRIDGDHSFSGETATAALLKTILRYVKAR
ncbi:MAG: hydrolase 1, exosortase A system-associated [Pacificimonas sp.]